MRHRTTLQALLLAASAAALAAQEAAPARPPAAAAPAQADASAQTPSFPSQVEQVIVDVVVTDKKGTPIRGLKREEITVLEDGTPQSVVSFEAIELPAEPTPTTAELPRVSVNTNPEEQRGRTFAIVFDDTHMTPWKANQAKAAVASFLEKGVRDGDRVALVSTAGGTWWTTRMPSGRAKLLDMVKRFDGRYIPDTAPDRMSDYEAMRIHVYRDPQVAARVLRRWEQYGVGLSTRTGQSRDSAMGLAGTVEDPMVTGRASEIYYAAMTRMRTTLDVLERVINGLAAAKGRKSVVLVSEGFVHDINLDEFKRVNDASRRANAAIYFVNSRGLEGMPMEMTAQFGPALPDQDVGFYFSETLDAVAGADVIATDSGGFVVRNTNDLSGGVQRIANETQAYYLLGYVPSNTARDGKFRKIQVKLANGKGLQVRARKGYYAPNDTGKTAFEPKKGVDPQLQAALDSPWAQDGIPLRMTHFIGEEKSLGKAEVLIATEIDTRGLEFEEKDGRMLADLQFLLIVAHRETGEFFRYDQGVNMKLLPATRERLARLWFPLVRDFELKTGDYQAKIVMRDTRSGRIGTVMHEFDVPPLDTFRVTTPVVSDTRQPATNAEGAAASGISVIVRREFAVGSDVFCRFEVFGAKVDEKSGMPNVTQGYEVRRLSDGAMLTGMAPSAIRPTSLGKLSRLFGFKLADATPGEYEIVMNFRDELAGESLQLTERFTVVPAPPEPAAAAQAVPQPATPAGQPPAQQP